MCHLLGATSGALLPDYTLLPPGWSVGEVVALFFSERATCARLCHSRHTRPPRAVFVFECDVTSDTVCTCLSAPCAARSPVV